MNETIKTMLDRRTIRKYKPEQITEDELNLILEVGLHAPNAGGRQSAIIVCSQNAEINSKLGKINKGVMPIGTPSLGRVSSEQPSILDDSGIKSAFYDAPTVLTLFAPKENFNLTADCFVAAQNMIIAASSLGIGSCMVARAIETFATEEGWKIQKEWGLDESYEAKVHIALGYPDGDWPTAKPRKDGRIIRVG